jgi:ribosomal protein S18 acetylase RimI-like enzyme
MADEDIQIRAALPEDADFLLPLINRAGEGIPEYIWAQMAAPGEDPREVGRRRIESEDSAISHRSSWIAELAGQPAGCLVAHRQPDVMPPVDPDMPSMFVPLQELENEAPGTGYVHILSTLREMRGRGVGKRLLDFADRYRGPNGMSIIVADNNHGARRLYERCGYREAARRRMVKNGWQSEGTAWILMVKP